MRYGYSTKELQPRPPKETIDQTLRRWLRNWLGIDAVESGLSANEAALLEFKKLLKDALNAVADTRQDLIQRMQDLSLELAKPKHEADESAKQESQTVVPAHVPFSVRRRQAEGSKRNMSAYLAPGKKPSA
jgi:hypothetical protein